MRIGWKVVIVFLMISALDLITTSYGLSIGLIEGNPLISSGGKLSLWRYLIFTMIGALILLPYSYYNRYIKTILAGMIVLKVFSPLNNLFLILLHAP